MTLTSLMKRLEKVAVDNSPAILTAIGVAGALTTAYLAGNASFKAARLLQPMEFVDPPAMTKDKVRLVWRLYLPAAFSASLTVVAVVSANRIGTRRAAALAAAYAVGERAFEEYKSKVIEKLGEKKERALRDEIAQQRVDRDPVSNHAVLVTGKSVLCYEAYTGRYFPCDMETLRKAQNDINHQVIHDSYASLSDLYDLIGLEHTSNSEEVGWNLDKLLEMDFSAVISDGGQPCIHIEFAVAPVRHYNRLQ